MSADRIILSIFWGVWWTFMFMMGAAAMISLLEHIFPILA
jgi:hypothetical protein